MKTENRFAHRIKELDSLRGIAALCVMYFHFTYFFRNKLNYSFDKSLDFQYGHHGVELFFIISGFVIFMSLHGIKSVKEFLYKRFVRLYPTYWICLTITISIILLSNTPYFSLNFNKSILNYLMFQGLFNIENIDGSYWSLLPELCFYATIITLWKLKLTEKPFLISVLWIILMFLALVKPTILDVLLNLKFGMFFIIGMMFYKMKTNRNLYYPHIVICFSLLAVYFVRGSLEAFLFTLFFILVFYLLIFDKLKFLNIRIFVFFGKISYTLYLLHQTIGLILISNLIKYGINDYLSVVASMFLIIVLSYIVYRYLEKPILFRIRSLHFSAAMKKFSL